MRLLLVEDEKAIGAPLQKGLTNKGFAVDWKTDGESGLESALINEYDCIVLDLNLPNMDGLEVAKQLREREISTPILMLTARTQQEDLLKGFDSGADDYLRKPFDFRELVHRIQSLIKRNSVEKSDLMSVEDVELDSKSYKVTRAGEAVDLNNKEFGVFEYLLRNRGSVVSQEELLEHVWDEQIDSFTQTVRTNIKTLRKKLDPDKKIIKTVKGRGYVIEN